MSRRILLFAAANLAYLVLTAMAAVSAESVHLLYLCPLFALCTTPLLLARTLNGPYSLLGVFFAIYFVFYGLQDSIAPWLGRPAAGSSDLVSPSEVAILLGGALALAGYAAALLVSRRASRTPPRKDWRPGTVVAVGLALWAIGFWCAWVWNVDLITDTTIATKNKALSGISSLRTTLLMLGQMAKPLGMLMIAYAQTVYRRAWLLPILLAVVLLQLLYGYVVDVKGEAMLGVVLVIATQVLVHGRLPKIWLAAGVLFVVFAFPVFQAHRVMSGSRGMDHAATARELGKSIQRALQASDRVSTGPNRANSFFERASLKSSVEIIVRRTGNGVAFRDGYTLTPLLTAFVPRIIWPDKPDVQAGQVMNRDFHISMVMDTYISPSHLGELYWNFGWPGILLGMPVIGFVLGTVGARCNLADRVSLTRVLILVVTIRYIVMGFEGTIAVSYVVWLRSLAGIWALHVLLTRAEFARDVLQRRARHSQGALTELGHTRTVPVP